MKEYAERTIEVGFNRHPRKVLDEVEQVGAEMMRNGWELVDSVVEDSLGNVHLMFERTLMPEENM